MTHPVQVASQARGDVRVKQHNGLRVAVVHDYLTQRGGAERVVLSLMQAFPEARLITSVYHPEGTFAEFSDFTVETSWLDRMPVFRRDPRRAMPLLPAVFGGVVLDDVDVVICSSSGWSHGVQTKAPKIVYCHNPPRWLYQRQDYVGEFPSVVRYAVTAMSPYLKWWDRRAAASAAVYVANSRSVADRVLQEYGVKAAVLPPAVDIDPLGDQEPVPGLEPGFLLTVGRARGYKNSEVVCAGVDQLGDERLVVVGGRPEGDWSDRVQGVKDMRDAQMRWLYASCSGIVAASYEDFGLTPVEAGLFGKPAVLLRAGGFLDTLEDGVNGVFFDDVTDESVAGGVRRLRSLQIDPAQVRRLAERFGPEAFRAAVQEEAELAVAALGINPWRETDPPRPHDNLQAVRAPVEDAAAVLAVAALGLAAAGAMARGRRREVLLATSGLTGLLSVLAVRLRLAFRRRAELRRTPEDAGVTLAKVEDAARARLQRSRAVVRALRGTRAGRRAPAGDA